MSNPVTAANLWGLQPKQVQVAGKKHEVAVPLDSGRLLSVAERQTMQMKSTLKQSLKPLSCSGAACLPNR